MWKERADGNTVWPLQAWNDDLGVWVEVHQHFAAGATRWHYREFADAFIRLRMTNGNCAFNGPVAVENSAAEGHCFCTHRQPSDRRTQM